jgi:hypothetical protein
MLLVFTEDNVPTWEIRRKAKKVAGRDDDLGAGLVPLVRKVPATAGRPRGGAKRPPRSRRPAER